MIEMKKDRTSASAMGVFQAGKRYSVAPEIERTLVDAGVAAYVGRPPAVETATAPPAPENAAERTEKPAPKWTLKTSPEEYLERYGDDGPNSALAREVLGL